MVTLLTLLCRLLLRVFFRSVEIVGSEKVPAGGKVLFALNHPNGLVDPLFILCHAGRPVSFLAKAPLFDMPVVGFFVKKFRCLPVHRKQDNNDPAKNRQMLEQAVELLSQGNALAIFPEGTSHSDPKLKPFRSGAMRIAVSGAALANDVVEVVPVGLYYSTKHVFRSNALLLFGEPLHVSAAALDELRQDKQVERRFREHAEAEQVRNAASQEVGGVFRQHDGGKLIGALEPDRERVLALTDELSRRVAQLTLQAQSADLVYLAKVAERVVVAANKEQGLPVPQGMAEKLRFRQELLAHYEELEGKAEVMRLVSRIRAYQASARALGLKVDQSFDYSSLGVARYLALNLGWLVVLWVPGVLGLISNYLTYRVVGTIAFRYSKAEVDVLATWKVVGGLLLFPLTWLLWGSIAGVLWGLWIGLATLALLPVCAYMSLMLVEALAGVARRGKALWLSLTRRGFVEQMVAERRSIRDELLRLAQALESVSASAAS
jgi:1-acyl-sn-glycerol-3-phosphate acyltransferase